MPDKRINTISDLVAWRAETGPATVLTGSFDILHPGNIIALEQAAKHAGSLCVIVDDDDSVAQRTDRTRPWHSAEIRAELAASLHAADIVIRADEIPYGDAAAALGSYSYAVCRELDDANPVLLSAAETIVDVPRSAGCCLSEIIQAIASGATPVSLPAQFDLAEHIQNEPASGVVTVNGCFDVLHIGHIRFLAAVARMGTSLIILMNDDSSVRNYKGDSRPVFPLGFRTAALMALSSVSGVRSFSEDNPLKLIEEIQPAIHVKGGTYEPDRVANEKALLEQWGGRIEFGPMVDGFSTTDWLTKAMA